MSRRDNDFWTGLVILVLLFCGFVIYNAPEMLTVPLALVGVAGFSFAFANTRPAMCRASLYCGVFGTAAVFYTVFLLAGPPRLLTFDADFGWPGLFWTDWLDSTRGFRDWGFYSQLFFRHFFWGPFKWIDPSSLSTLWWGMAATGFLVSYLYPSNFFDSPYFSEKKDPPGVPRITDWGEGWFEFLEIFWAPLLMFPRRVAVVRGRGVARAVAAIEGLIIGCLGLVLLAASWHFFPSSSGMPFLVVSVVIAFTLSGFHFVLVEPIVLLKRETILGIARREQAEKIERELYWQRVREEAAQSRARAAEQAQTEEPAPKPVTGEPSQKTEAESEIKKPKKADFWSDGGGDF